VAHTQPLAFVMAARKMTVTQLAEAVGIKRGSMSRIVNGRRHPWSKHKAAIARALSVDVNTVEWPERTDAPIPSRPVLLEIAKRLTLEAEYAAASGDLAREHGYDVLDNPDEAERLEGEAAAIAQQNESQVNSVAFEIELERRLRSEAFVKELSARIKELGR
jgi:transcriptional regulator with XRE-family HTH domain